MTTEEIVNGIIEAKHEASQAFARKAAILIGMLLCLAACVIGVFGVYTLAGLGVACIVASVLLGCAGSQTLHAWDEPEETPEAPKAPFVPPSAPKNWNGA